MDKGLYARPKKPRSISVRKRERAAVAAPLVLPEPTAVDRATECHVTPPDVAARMVEYLDASRGMLALEPHCGTGNLIAALLDADHSRFELVAIERHHALCQTVKKRFNYGSSRSNYQHPLEPINECFLEYAERAKGGIEYPAIICNPPYKKIKAHMNAALSLLGRDGHNRASMVALVPITYHHPDAELMEELPIDTFSSAAVRTKIVRFSV